MTYAVIATGGKQYKVELGEVLEVETLEVKGKVVVFDQVLLMAEGDKVEVGTPTLKGITVKGELVELARKDDKIRVFKFKSKSRYRKLRGHRQTHTVVKITDIGGTQLAAPKKAEVKEKVEAVKKVPVKKAAPKKSTVKKAVAK